MKLQLPQRFKKKKLLSNVDYVAFEKLIQNNMHSVYLVPRYVMKPHRFLKKSDNLNALKHDITYENLNGRKLIYHY